MHTYININIKVLYTSSILFYFRVQLDTLHVYTHAFAQLWACRESNLDH